MSARALLGAALAALALSAPPAQGLPSDARITTAGLGAVRIGMTAAQVERAAHSDLGRRPRPGKCTEIRIGRRVWGLFTGRRLARIDVRTRRYATLSRVRVGDTQDQVLAIYGVRIDRQPHKYTRGWYYLRYTDGNRRVVFETDGELVRMISTGRMPEIDYVEGCS